MNLSDAFVVKFESCTGTLISDDWILSAAHCFSDQRKSKANKNQFGDYEVINVLTIVLSFMPNQYVKLATLI